MSPEILADFFLSLYGVALVVALFFGLTLFRKRLLKLLKLLKRKIRWLWRGGVSLTLVYALTDQEPHIVVTRLGVLAGVVGYGWLWRRRYKRARGKQRAIYYLPEGTNYAHRDRLARQTGTGSTNQSAHHADNRETSASPPVETETCHE